MVVVVLGYCRQRHDMTRGTSAAATAVQHIQHAQYMQSGFSTVT